MSSPQPFTPMIKNKMSITQSYFLAHTARRKLSREASRPDHNLRLLVGHANMLDTLMYELAEAEAAQEKWFQTNLDNKIAEKQQQEQEVKSRRTSIQWADAVRVEVDERDLDGSDSESSEEEYEDSEYDEDEEDEFELLVRGRVAEKVSVKPATTSFTMITTPSTPVISTHEIADEDIYEEEVSDSEDLSLHRTSSHINDDISVTVIEPPSPTTSEPSSPPLLTHDMSSDSEESDDDDLLMMPPSPKDNVVADPFTSTKMAASHDVDSGFYALSSAPATIAAY